MDEQKLLVKFYWDCGRQGSITGLFVSTQSEIDKHIGKTIYFGEALGKHSDIHGALDKSDFTMKSDDQDFINKLIDIMGSTRISGRNPFDYYEDYDPDGEND